MILAVRRKREPSENWRTFFYEFLDTRLDKIEKEYSIEDLGEISKAVFQERTEILGRLILGLIGRKFGHLLNQEDCECPHCGKGMQRQGNLCRHIKTLAGEFELSRPYLDKMKFFNSGKTNNWTTIGNDQPSHFIISPFLFFHRLLVDVGVPLAGNSP